MRIRPSSVALAIAIACALASSGSVAQAGPRVAVSPLSGAKTETIEKQLEELVADEFELVPRKRVRRYAKRAEYSSSAEALARKVKADAVITGKLRRLKRKGKKPRRYRLTLYVTSKSGEDLGTIKIRLRQRSLRTKDRRTLRKELGELLGAGQSDDAEVAEEGDVIDDSSGASAGDEDLRDSDSSSDDDLPATSSGDLPASREASVIANVGLSLVSRSLDFTFTQGLMDQPQGYSGFPFGGVVLAGELYPLLLASKRDSPLAGVGLSADYGRLVLVSSEVQGRPDVKLDTEQSQWGVGLVYRWRLGASPAEPALRLSVGYNQLSFAIDRAGLPADVMIDVPNVSYRYIDPGVAIEYPLSPKLALDAGARFLLVTAAGEVSNANQYGSSTVTGFHGSAGVALRVAEKIYLRAAAELWYFGFDFDGNGELTDRDNDGNQDVGGAADRLLSGQLGAVVLY